MAKENNALDGKTYEIPMMELRNNIGSIITKVQMGATYILLHGKNKKPVAVLQCLPGERLTINIDGNGKTTYKG